MGHAATAWMLRERLTRRASTANRQAQLASSGPDHRRLASRAAPNSSPACPPISAAYVIASGDPTHFVDVTDTIGLGVASLREHRAYIEGLGREFDPDEFLRSMAGYVGLGAGCDYAVSMRRYPMG